MAVTRLDASKLQPKRVKRLRIAPVATKKAYKRLEDQDAIIAAKQLHKPPIVDVIQIEMGSITIEFRPIDPLIAQIQYLPDGNTVEEEIYTWLFNAERNFSAWNQSFSEQILIEWKKLTKDLPRI